MNTLSSVLEKQSLPPGMPTGNVVTHVMDSGRPIPINPQIHTEVTCPMCGGSEGYHFMNGPHERWWTCCEKECISRNRDRTKTIKPDEIPRDQLLRHAGVPENLIHASFADWKHPDQIRKDLVAWLRKSQGFCVLMGPPGCGKSYIAAAMIGHWSQNNARGARFSSVVDIKYQWIEEMRSEGLKTLPLKMTECDLLVVDDFDKVNPSDAFYEFIYLVVNSRYSNAKPTILTSNIGIEDLEKRVGGAISSRIFSKEGIALSLNSEDRRSHES